MSELIHNYELYLYHSAELGAILLEFFGVFVLFFSSIKCFIQWIKKDTRHLRLNLAEGIALSLEFKMGTGGILHRQGKHVGHANHDACLGEDAFAFLGLINDETQNTELGCICQGKRANIDVILCQKIGNCAHTSLLVFQKYG